MITRIFGKPGAGKTSYGVHVILQTVRDIANNNAPYRFVFSNFAVDHPLVCHIPFEFLGKYNLEDSLIVIDEATMHADSRDHKEFPPHVRDFILEHRHHVSDPKKYRCDIIFISQGFNRIDKTIREITEKVFYIKKCLLNKDYSKVIPLHYGYNIPIGSPSEDDSSNTSITEGYYIPSKFSILFAKSFNRKATYPFYNSWEHTVLPSIPVGYIHSDRATWGL